ncbi:hypothetical protein CC80DRAFT_32275 [Byssothecium circinans]|uniref:Transmembrane protein n=1 Tax=Byssothecium circinans TaxID=147558 RepID=A0A6A5TYK0_9PLEO|nr:hypothetical protein CC80DRAFT_32275 [Byssothecium circinans]
MVSWRKRLIFGQSHGGVSFSSFFPLLFLVLFFVFLLRWHYYWCRIFDAAPLCLSGVGGGV